jgi:transcriptional regulator with XRE-family HTH domain
MTIEKFAEKLDVSPQWVSRVEKGEENLSLRTLWKLGTTLGVSTRDLLPDR